MIDIDDVLEAARREAGLDGLANVKFAVLERDGTISIVPGGCDSALPRMRREAVAGEQDAAAPQRNTRVLQ